MKFSIITVTRNSEFFLEQTILSVISQTYSNIEYIVIDGSSTDNTLTIIDKYRDKIAYFISEPDKNMYDAINKGMKAATGDYIAILNSDDYYVDDKVIQRVVNEVNKLKISNLGGIYGNLIKVAPDNSKIRNRRGFQVSFKQLLFSTKLTMVGHASVFIHKKCLENVGFYDAEHFSAAADYDYILRCFAQHKFKYLNLDIFNFRQHPNSVTSSGKITMEVDSVLEKNGYYTYNPLLRYVYYYYSWAKFILLNSVHLVDKIYNKWKYCM
ncbi:glycosyl transferase [Bacteroidia bacterium]|nr:glycosyl transferase [Bacteroidia bacterium]